MSSLPYCPPAAQAPASCTAVEESGSHHDAREWPCSWIRYNAKGRALRRLLWYIAAVIPKVIGGTRPSLNNAAFSLCNCKPPALSLKVPLSLIRYFTLWSLHKVVAYRCLVACLSIRRVQLRDLRAAEQLVLRSEVACSICSSAHGDLVAIFYWHWVSR